MFKSESKRLILSDVNNIPRNTGPNTARALLTLNRPKRQEPQTKISTLICRMGANTGQKSKFSTLPRNLKISNRQFDFENYEENKKYFVKIDPKAKNMNTPTQVVKTMTDNWDICEEFDSISTQSCQRLSNTFSKFRSKMKNVKESADRDFDSYCQTYNIDFECFSDSTVEL